MQVRRYGWNGWLLEVDDVAGWFRALSAARERGELRCREIVPAARTVLLDGLIAEPPDFSRLAPQHFGEADDDTDARTDARDAAGAAVVVLPVHWDGPDLAEVACRWGEDPIAVMQATEFTVAFCGFAPGFAYLTGLPEHRWVPRLGTPRTRVPAGSVGLAGPYAGVYPRSSPGGWLLLGRTRARLFQLDADPPALLTPGTRVRFTHD